MTTRTVPDLKELFKQASEIAQQVPPNMQEAAFNRAVDLLTGGSGGNAGGAKNRSDVPRTDESSRSPTKSRKVSPPVMADNQLDALLQTVDSTQHPGIASATKHLDRALMVLKIALDEQSIDGLSPGDIARILREKFRTSATDQAVGMALARAATLVDRVKGSDGYIYRIMAPGIAYLTGLNAEGGTAMTQRPSARKSKKAVAPRPASPQALNSSRDASATKVKKKQAKGSAASRPGSSGLAPKAAVLGLIADGYFSSPKTGLAVQEYLKAKRGYAIGTAQLRLAMLRLVREQQLEREANVNGDYEYKHR